jgi:hypothetical protein
VSARRYLVAPLCACLLAVGCGDEPQPSRGSLEPPKLADPETIQLDGSDTSIVLEPGRDYVLELPGDGPVDVPKAVRVDGGRNVVMVGGTINVTEAEGGLTLVNQTGTVHVEGVRITGPRLQEGIDLAQSRGATVQLQNVHVATVHGSQEGHHADLLQTWAGPRRLYVDGFVGSTTYQGFFLLPNELYDGPPPELVSLRNVYIDASDGVYVLWRAEQAGFPLRVEDVFVEPNRRLGGRDQWLWPKPSTGDRSWREVKVGKPSQALLERVAAAGPGYR